VKLLWVGHGRIISPTFLKLHNFCLDKLFALTHVSFPGVFVYKGKRGRVIGRTSCRMTQYRNSKIGEAIFHLTITKGDIQRRSSKAAGALE